MNLQADTLRNRAAAVSLLLLLIALVGVLLIGPLWERYTSNRDQIAELENNVVRFESVAGRQAELERQFSTLERASNLGELTLQADSATLAAADLQERVKAAVQAAGGSLTSTQVLEPEKVSSFERVSVNVRMTGSTPAVQKSLYALESGSPVLVIDNLLVVTRRTTVRLGARRREQQQDWLDVRFKVSGFYQAAFEQS